MHELVVTLLFFSCNKCFVFLLMKNAVLVGRKTWFSIPPQRRPLQGRINILLSRELPESPEGAHLARSFKEAMNIITSGPLAAKVESVFVIGGSSLYHEAMSSSCACRIYLTRVMRDFHCDTFLPSINYDVFHKIPNPENIPSEVLTEDDIDFKFEVYEKI